MGAATMAVSGGAAAEHLVSEAKQGSLEAFEAIYRTHVGRVMAICVRLSGDRERAEDLVQETFIRAWERLGLYETGTHFAAWLARIAVNVSLSERRSGQRRQQREKEAGAAGSTLTAPAGAQLDLERALARLPAPLRHVVVLHDVEGYKHREIARLLDLAPGTSKARLHRARQMLREVFSS